MICGSVSLQIARLPQIQALGMTRFDFDDFKLDADEMVKASLRLYIDLGLLQKFKIDPEVHVICTSLFCAKLMLRKCNFSFGKIHT